MKLSYRGANYDAPSMIETLETELQGKYRGTVVAFRMPHGLPSNHSTVSMKYRGITHAGMQ